MIPQQTSTNLYNYDARLYDPVIGRFVTADSMVPDPFNPQSLNRYSYCLNNPVKYIDPTGHWFDGVESDPSDYDVDYGGNSWGTHVDDFDGDDPGESGWGFDNDSNTWVDLKPQEHLVKAAAAGAGFMIGVTIVTYTPVAIVTVKVALKKGAPLAEEAVEKGAKKAASIEKEAAKATSKKAQDALNVTRNQKTEFGIGVSQGYLAAKNNLDLAKAPEGTALALGQKVGSFWGNAHSIAQFMGFLP